MHSDSALICWKRVLGHMTYIPLDRRRFSAENDGEMYGELSRGVAAARDRLFWFLKKRMLVLFLAILKIKSYDFLDRGERR
jgi:hypothetical protein